jgi:hypothetical protein
MAPQVAPVSRAAQNVIRRRDASCRALDTLILMSNCPEQLQLDGRRGDKAASMRPARPSRRPNKKPSGLLLLPLLSRRRRLPQMRGMRQRHCSKAGCFRGGSRVASSGLCAIRRRACLFLSFACRRCTPAERSLVGAPPLESMRAHWAQSPFCHLADVIIWLMTSGAIIEDEHGGTSEPMRPLAGHLAAAAAAWRRAAKSN